MRKAEKAVKEVLQDKVRGVLLAAMVEEIIAVGKKQQYGVLAVEHQKEFDTYRLVYRAVIL